MNSKDQPDRVEGDLESILVSVKTGCRLLGLGPTKMYELIAAGAIKSKKIGNKRLLDYQSIKAAAA